MSRAIQSSVFKRFPTPLRLFAPLDQGIVTKSPLTKKAVRHQPVQTTRSYNIHSRGRYGIHELMINRSLTKEAVKTLRTASKQQKRLNSTAKSSSKSGSAPKESIFSKFKRATTFTISTVAVVGASGLALIVIYLLLAEIAFPSGDTQTFNRAVSLVERDEVSQKLLQFQKGERLKAFGETPGDKWTRNRPISSVRRPGLDGKEHVLMRFHVESKSKVGTIQLEAVDESWWKQEFSYVILDVPGENRHYIVKPKTPENRLRVKNKDTGFLGVKWGPKKD